MEQEKQALGLFSKSGITKLTSISFKPKFLVWKFLNDCYDKSLVINRALILWMQYTQNPIKLMFKLKEQHPELWKYANRYNEDRRRKQPKSK